MHGGERVIGADGLCALQLDGLPMPNASVARAFTPEMGPCSLLRPEQEADTPKNIDGNHITMRFYLLVYRPLSMRSLTVGWETAPDSALC